MSAIATALRRHGIPVTETYDRTPPGTFVFAWSWKWCKEILQKHPSAIVCTLDHGLFHPRNRTVVTGWMGLNGLGEHPWVEDNGARLRKMGWDEHRKPFRKPGRVALILGQCYNDVQILDHLEDYGQWLRDRCDELQREGWDVRFRPHPVQRRNDLDRYPRFAPMTLGPTVFEDIDRENVGCVLAFNSNALLDSYFYGVQDVRLYNGGSMLFPASAKLGDSYRVVGPREQLMERLAYCQWTPEEIAQEDLWAELHIPIMRRLLEQTPRALQPWWTHSLGGTI
jgi:hypothetical protein